MQQQESNNLAQNSDGVDAAGDFNEKLPIAERRQIENEMLFRRANEKVGDDLDRLDEKQIEDGFPELVRDANLVLHFICECSDENCNERILIRLDDYQDIHQNRDTFIVKLKHQVNPIEKIIQTAPGYNIVMKNHSTQEPGNKLNTTSINNT